MEDQREYFYRWLVEFKELTLNNRETISINSDEIPCIILCQVSGHSELHITVHLQPLKIEKKEIKHRTWWGKSLPSTIEEVKIRQDPFVVFDARYTPANVPSYVVSIDRPGKWADILAVELEKVNQRLFDYRYAPVGEPCE